MTFLMNILKYGTTEDSMYIIFSTNLMGCQMTYMLSSAPLPKTKWEILMSIRSCSVLLLLKKVMKNQRA